MNMLDESLSETTLYTSVITELIIGQSESDIRNATIWVTEQMINATLYCMCF